MPWSEKHKILFIHIPKTGGTSIEYALNMKKNSAGYGVVNNKAIQHYKWDEYSQLNTPNFEDFIRISIVRNPYTRFLSEYYWCQIKGLGYNSKQSINEFLTTVETIVKNKNFYETRFHDHFIPQHEFIYDAKKEELVVDQLFHFEKMEDVREFLYKYWRWLPHKLKNRGHTTALTKEQQSRIYKLYKKDFTLFGYQRFIENDSNNTKNLIQVISLKFIFFYILYKIDKYLKETIKILRSI